MNRAHLSELVRCEADVAQFGSAVERLKADLAAHRAGINSAAAKLDRVDAYLRRVGRVEQGGGR